MSTQTAPAPAVDQKRLVRLGDRVNWRTVNGRGNPCSKLATVYFEPREGMATIYVYGQARLRRVPLGLLRRVKPNAKMRDGMGEEKL